MWVKYIGKHDAIYTEFNGKKYAFSRKTPIKNIPIEVFDSIRSSGHESAAEIVPCEFNDGIQTKTADESQPLIEEERVEKKRGRPVKKYK